MPVRPNVTPDGIPRTFAAAGVSGGQPRFFAPALRHYPSAIRRGGPVIDRTTVRDHWPAMRRLATEHLPRNTAESPAGELLILRVPPPRDAIYGVAGCPGYVVSVGVSRRTPTDTT